MTDTNPTPLDGPMALGALAALLSTRRAALHPAPVLAVRIVEDGAYTVDVESEWLLRPGDSEHSDLRIITNRRTLSDLLVGAFDPSAPEAEHLFVLSGKKEALNKISAALTGGQSWLSARVDAVTQTKKRRPR